jgi:TRAP-type C4-dicarboxylate transport system permease small subunit
MSFLIRAKRLLNRAVDACVMSLMAVLAVVLFLAVITRYMFNFPLAWSEEVSRYAFVWLSFLGAELCFRANMHIGVDLLVRLFPLRVQQIVWRGGQALAAILLIGLLIAGINMTALTYDQLSPALGIPMSFVYLAVPVGAALMCLELVIQVVCDHPVPSEQVAEL